MYNCSECKEQKSFKNTGDYKLNMNQKNSIRVAQSLNRVQLFATTCTAAFQASLSFTISQSLLNLMSIESVRPFNHLILCCSSSFPQSFPAASSFAVSWLFASSGQRTGASASASVSSNEYSGLISLRIDWFHLLADQGILESLLQHHSSKASILWSSAKEFDSTLTSIHDNRKKHSFDYMYLCWQHSDFVFLICCLSLS